MASRFAPSQKQKSTFSDSVKCTIDEEGDYEAIVTRVSEVFQPKNSTEWKIVIEFQLLDDEGNKLKTPDGDLFIVAQWEKPLFDIPRNPKYASLYNKIEKAGTLDQSPAIEEAVRSVTNEDLADAILAEFVRRSLLGRKCKVQVENTTQAKLGIQYAKIQKVRKVRGGVPNVGSIADIGDAAAKNMVAEAAKRPNNDKGKEHPAITADKKEKSEVLSEKGEKRLETAVESEPVKEAEVTGEASKLLATMRTLVMVWPKIIDSEKDGDIRNEMRQKGQVPDTLIIKYLTANHKVNDAEVVDAIKAMYGTGSLIHPRDHICTLMTHDTTEIVAQDAQEYLDVKSSRTGPSTPPSPCGEGTQVPG